MIDGASTPVQKSCGFDGVWTRLTRGDDPAVPPVRLGSSPPASRAQPLVNSPQDFRTRVLAARRLTAVDVQRLTGGERGPLEVEDRVHDFADFADAPERVEVA